MAPRETENNAYAKFGLTNKEHYGMLWYFLEWSIGLRFFQLDREFFCLLPSLTRLYSAAASPSERLRSDGSLAIKIEPKKELNKLITSCIKK